MSTYRYNRTKKTFAVKKKRGGNPISEDYGVNLECYETFLVLANDTGTSWQNDITSAWYKTFVNTDTLNFKLYKDDGTLATYQPQKKAFISNPLDFYATINWSDVLSSDGQGCYTYQIEAIIDGQTIPNIIWGEYNLLTYSPQNAMGSIRLSSLFDQYNSIEDIDFTNSKVKDTIRLGGFFGKREPNMVIDNLIYQGRTIKNVQRELLNTYEINTDPIQYQTAKRLIDLHLLTECELYLSDHNFFNVTAEYKDIPVIVKESPTIDYFDISQLCKIKCIVSDKNINTLAKYN